MAKVTFARPAERSRIHVLKSVYHRNGISGIGFYTLHIKWSEEGYEQPREAVATVNAFDVEAKREGKRHDPDTRVLMLDDAGGVDIEQTMRGDWFHDDLVAYLIREEDRRIADRAAG